MGTLNYFCIAAASAALAACATPTKSVASDFALTGETARILIMEPTADMGLISAAGVREARADWTETAVDNLLSSFDTQLSARGANTVNYADDKPIDDQIFLLAETVMGSALAHGPGIGAGATPLPLPTKQDAFEYTLGDTVRPLGEAYDADYALFIYTRGDFASAANQALQVGIGILFGGVVIPSGGQRFTLTSLVDLDDGDMVWMDVRMMGDARNPAEADAIVSDLVARIPQVSAETATATEASE